MSFFMLAGFLVALIAAYFYFDSLSDYAGQFYSYWFTKDQQSQRTSTRNSLQGLHQSQQAQDLRTCTSVEDFRDLMVQTLHNQSARWRRLPQGTIPYESYSLLLTTTSQHAFLAWRLQQNQNGQTQARIEAFNSGNMRAYDQLVKHALMDLEKIQTAFVERACEEIHLKIENFLLCHQMYMKDSNKRQILLQAYYQKMEMTFAREQQQSKHHQSSAKKSKTDEESKEQSGPFVVPPEEMSKEDIIEAYQALRKYQYARSLSFQEALKQISIRTDPEQALLTFSTQHLQASDYLLQTHQISFYDLMREMRKRGLMYTKPIKEFHEQFRKLQTRKQYNLPSTFVADLQQRVRREVQDNVQNLSQCFDTHQLASQSERDNDTGVCALSLNDYARVVALSAQSATLFCDNSLRGRQMVERTRYLDDLQQYGNVVQEHLEQRHEVFEACLFASFEALDLTIVQIDLMQRTYQTEPVVQNTVAEVIRNASIDATTQQNKDQAQNRITELTEDETIEALQFYLQTRNETRVEVHEIVMRSGNPSSLPSWLTGQNSGSNQFQNSQSLSASQTNNLTNQLHLAEGQDQNQEESKEQTAEQSVDEQQASARNSILHEVCCRRAEDQMARHKNINFQSLKQALKKWSKQNDNIKALITKL